MKRRGFFATLAAAFGAGAMKATEPKPSRYVYMMRHDNGTFMGAEKGWPPLFYRSVDDLREAFMARVSCGRIPNGTKSFLHTVSLAEARSMGCIV